MRRVSPVETTLTFWTLESLHAGELIPVPLAERESRQSWEASGKRTVESKARDKARALLAGHEVPPLPDEVLRELEAIVQRVDRVLTGP